MSIDPTNPKQPKKELPIPSEERPVKAALDYRDLVRMRELLLQEIIDDLGGSATVTPDTLTLVELRLGNAIAAGLDRWDVANFLEE